MIVVNEMTMNVYCEQTTDDGGWTLIASFVNDDGARSWATVESLQSPGPGFGALDVRETADYKSPAYGAVAANDILVMTEEYDFAFHDVLESQSFSSFMTTSWPTTCSSAWLREGADFTRNLTASQAVLLGISVRAVDPNDSACFPLEEAAALAFLAGDVQNQGLGNSPNHDNEWGSLDMSLPRLANFTAVACTPPMYPCNAAGARKLWDGFGTAAKARRALVFVR